jgi:hypothetical protein
LARNPLLRWVFEAAKGGVQKRRFGATKMTSLLIVALMLCFFLAPELLGAMLSTLFVLCGLGVLIAIPFIGMCAENGLAPNRRNK